MDRQKLIEDTIRVDAINKDGQVFDRVSRIHASGLVNRLNIELDVNTDIYPMQLEETYKFVLASSVNADGSDTFDIIQYENSGSASGMGTLIDDYDYVMHGKIFKYQLDEEQRNITIYVSFGGLLMSIKGEVKTLKALQIDSRIYLLMKEQ